MSNESAEFCEIKNFSEFLEKSLGRTVYGYTLKSLTKPGENYGSTMQSVDVKLSEENSGEEPSKMRLVAKTTITNPYLIEVFKPSISFVKEINFYVNTLPAVKYIEEIACVPQSERIDAFIQHVGSRLSLDPNASIADSDAILMLENVKTLNYNPIDRLVGCDTDETLEILKQLAKFHALCIAMRRQHHELFASRVRPYLGAINLIVDGDTGMVDNVCSSLQLIDNIDPKLRPELEKQLQIGFQFTTDTCVPTDTPFTTFVHLDLWSNNIMIKKVDGVIKIKIYDFQLYFYQSFVHDLVFFIYTSVRSKDLMDFKLFIDHYHQEFIKTMESVKCPTDDYTFEKMWHEIQQRAKIELLHILFMSKLALIDENTFINLDEATADSFFRDGPPSERVLARWSLIIDSFVKNGLI